MAKAVCIKCEKSMRNIADDFGHQGYQPVDGIAFHAQGHYGTAYFDPMDGSYLEIAVCDQCVEAAEKAGHVYRSPASENGGLPQ